jgi:septum formation protein
MTRPLADGRRLILASTSIFRKRLLRQLELPFISVSPGTDETPLAGETAPALTARLAALKARAVAERESGALVIGSDQVAVLDDEIIGKPGNHERAVAQLSRASGKTVIFYTGFCLIDSDSNREQLSVERFEVTFRKLTAAQTDRYLRRDQPYQCAGSFKAESLGIALFEKLTGDDPNSLIGLPLIRLVTMLQTENIELF